MISCCFFPVVHAPLHDSHRFSCVRMHSFGTSRGKRAPGISFSFKETVLIAELTKVFDDSPPDTIFTVCLRKRFAQVFTAIRVPGPNSFLEWVFSYLFVLAFPSFLRKDLCLQFQVLLFPWSYLSKSIEVTLHRVSITL